MDTVRDTAAQCRPGDRRAPFPEWGGERNDRVVTRSGRKKSPRGGDVPAVQLGPTLRREQVSRVMNTTLRWRWVCRAGPGWDMRSSSPRCWRAAVVDPERWDRTAAVVAPVVATWV